MSGERPDSAGFNGEDRYDGQATEPIADHQTTERFSVGNEETDAETAGGFAEAWNALGERQRQAVKVLGGAAAAAVVFFAGSQVGSGESDEALEDRENEVDTVEAEEDEDDEGLDEAEVIDEEESEEETKEAQEVGSSDVMPEEIHEYDLLAQSTAIEQQLERLISDNDLEMMWRGMVTKSYEREDGERVMLRMEYPVAIELDEKIYWTAYHPETGEFLSIEIGQVEDGDVVLEGAYYSTVPWGIENMERSAQFTMGRLRNLSREGIESTDYFEKQLRNQDATYHSKAILTTDPDIASENLSSVRYADEHYEEVFQDFYSYDEGGV